MKIKLSCDDVPEDLEGVVADIRIEDTSEADAPSVQLSSIQVEPFSLSSSQPVVSFDVADPDLPFGERELSLFVRVRATTESGELIEYFNTTSTPLSGDPGETVNVALERIS